MEGRLYSERLTGSSDISSQKTIVRPNDKIHFAVLQECLSPSPTKRSRKDSVVSSPLDHGSPMRQGRKRAYSRDLIRRTKLEERCFNEAEATQLFHAKAADTGQKADTFTLRRFITYCQANCLERKINLQNMGLKEKSVEVLA